MFFLSFGSPEAVTAIVWRWRAELLESGVWLVEWIFIILAAVVYNGQLCFVRPQKKIGYKRTRQCYVANEGSAMERKQIIFGHTLWCREWLFVIAVTLGVMGSYTKELRGESLEYCINLICGIFPLYMFTHFNDAKAGCFYFYLPRQIWNKFETIKWQRFILSLNISDFSCNLFNVY